MRIKRISTLAAVGLVLIVAAAGYVYFWQTRPIGSGPAGVAVPAAAFSKVWTERRVLLVGLGDSVTAGFGARRGYSYFDRLISNPIDEFADMRGICLRTVFPHLQSTNLAVSGSTSAEHLAQQLPRLPLADSNTLTLVVVTTGGNDIIHNYGRTPPREQAMYGAPWDQAAPWVTNFEQRLGSMLQSITEHYPGGCQIFVANIFDPTDGIGDAERAGLPPWKDGTRVLAAYNDAIGRCAERYPFVHLVNIRAAFLGHGIHCTQFWSPHYDAKDPHYWYFSNLEDPNERGYDAIRRLLLIEMTKTHQGDVLTGGEHRR
jgi:lysophospholipase L1-like esterase